MASALRSKLEFFVTVAVLIALAVFSLAHSPSRADDAFASAATPSAAK